MNLEVFFNMMRRLSKIRFLKWTLFFKVPWRFWVNIRTLKIFQQIWSFYHWCHFCVLDTAFLSILKLSLFCYRNGFLNFIDSVLLAYDLPHLAISVSSFKFLQLFRSLEILVSFSYGYFTSVTQIWDIAGIMFDRHLHRHVVKRTCIVEWCSISFLGIFDP